VFPCMKRVSRDSGTIFRWLEAGGQYRTAARAVGSSSHLRAFAVDYHSKVSVARQVCSPIFTILTICRSDPNAARWVNAFGCLVELFAVREVDFGDIERRFSLVATPFYLWVPCPLSLAVLHFGFVSALSTVLLSVPQPLCKTLSRGAPRTLFPPAIASLPTCPGAQEI